MKEALKIFIAIVVLAGAGYGGVKAYIYKQVKAFMDAVVLSTAGVIGIEYGGITSSLKGTIGIEDLRIKSKDIDDEIRIGALLLNAPNLRYLMDAQEEIANNSFPRTMSISIRALEMNTSGGLMKLVGDASNAISRSYGINDDNPCESPDLYHFMHYRTVGYDKLVLDVDFGYEWLRESNRVRVFSSDRDRDGNGFDIDTTVTLPDTSTPDKLAKFKTRIVENRIVMHQKGLNKRVADFCAQQKQVDAATYAAAKASAPDKHFENKWGFVPGAGLRAAYQQHLLSGDSITLVMKPNNPVHPDDFGFYTSADLVKLLNLEVSIGNAAVQDLSFRLPEYVPPRSFGQQLLASMPELRSYTQGLIGDDDTTEVAAHSASKNAQNAQQEYQVVRSTDLSKHVGRDVRISTSDGQTRVGWLQNLTKKEITVSWNVGGGEMSAVIPYERIKKAEVLLEAAL